MTRPTAAQAARGLPIRIAGVHRTFDADAIPVPALAGISLDIEPGEFLTILGPSGCGKSTLLRLIAGLDHPDTGEIRIDDSAAHQLPRGLIGYVFQDASLLPWRSVLRNVTLPMELLGKPSADAHAAATEALQRVGLADAMTRYPNQLSGGMKMRVAIARAMVTRPRLLLMDEPFAALDEISRQALDDQLRQLWIETRITIIFVTHSIIEAAYLGRRSLVMTPRPGRIALDRVLDLPAERPPELRTDARFAAEMRRLFDALASGAPGGAA